MNPLKNSKKGNVNLVLTGVTIIFIAGFLFVMGLIILDELLVNTATTQTTTNNETLTTVTETGESVVNSGLCGFHGATLVRVTYKDNSTLIDNANFSMDGRSGLVTYVGVDAAINNNSDVNVTYSYTYSNDESCLATNETIYGQGKFADYVDLIVLAIVITVIISMLLIVFSMRRVQ